MANSLIQFAYVSGEVSDRLYGRSDLEKYDLGLALARNWYVDFRGGLVTRAGTEYRDWMQNSNLPLKWIPFEFAANTENTNLIVFGQNYIRFLQEGRYILEANKTIVSMSYAAASLITVTAHGLLDGDLVKITALTGPNGLTGRTYRVQYVNVNSFFLLDQFDEYLSLIGQPAFSAGTLAKVYTLASPYAATDLDELNFEQIRDTLRLTHYLYPTYDLVRLSEASWTITQTDFDGTGVRPVNLSGFASSGGTAGCAYGVTAVDHDGNESVMSDILITAGIVNFTTTAGNYTLGWNIVPNTAYYNVYRSTVSDEVSKVTRTAQLGFLGVAYGAQFLDTNIIPDFTKLAPRQNNPFANSSIQWITVTNGGSGYTQASGISISDATGTGAVAYPVVSAGGSLTGVVVINGGYGYTAPSLSVTVGAGATFSVQLGAASGNYPAVSRVFQQRQIYGGTLNVPLGLWGSRPRRFNNFDQSPIIVDNDSYEFEIDATKVGLVRHLIGMRGGLLVLNEIGVWQLSGGQSGVITPTNALAEPQSYTGVSSLTPLNIETDLLYVESKGFTVRLLSYSDLAKLYSGQDLSILCPHFFGTGKEIVSWAFAQEPNKLIHAVREDGFCLTGTIDKGQNLFAWTLNSTKGFYRQVVSIREGKRDAVYYDVERQVRGKTVRYIEFQQGREYRNIEFAWAVDAGLRTEPTYPNPTLYVAAAGPMDTIVNCTISPVITFFTSGDVGKRIYAGGGKLEVVEFIDGANVRAIIRSPILDLFPETELPKPFGPGEWTFDAPVTFVDGLGQLEGETVQVLAEGSVVGPKTVLNGRITLDNPAFPVIAGLGFKAIARNLPLTASGAVIEDKRKRIVGIATRVYESRGLKTGARLDQLYEAKERTIEILGQPTFPQTKVRYSAITPEYDQNGQTYFVVDTPLPVTLLGHVVSTEVGDDQN